MDTEGNFRPERVEAIAERFGLDPTETLENVIVTRVFNHEQQIERAHVRGRCTVVIPWVLEHTNSRYFAYLPKRQPPRIFSKKIRDFHGLEAVCCEGLCRQTISMFEHRPRCEQSVMSRSSVSDS